MLFTDFEHKFEIYAAENEPLGAFTYLLGALSVMFKQVDFNKIKQSCVLRGIGFSPAFRDKMKATTNTEEVLDVLDDFYIYCNWLNVRYLKIIVKNADMSEAEKLISSFEKHFYSKKVSEVKDNIHCGKSFVHEHVHNITLKINTRGHELTVEELIKYCRGLESMGLPEGSVTPTDSGQPGCLLLACAIPLHSCLHAYEKIQLNTLRFRKLHIQYINIESYPKIFSYPFNKITKEFLVKKVNKGWFIPCNVYVNI